MMKVRRADLLVMNGLELDRWAEVVVQGANNPNVIPGAPGRVDASTGIQVLEVPTTRVDRSMGDVHPIGNPHYTIDPGLAPAVTANILEGLARLAPQSRPTFERNRETFLTRLDQAMAGWTRILEPYKGAKVVQYHPDFV
jgi:zinc/manganese transport system substrate-binding protein